MPERIVSLILDALLIAASAVNEITLQTVPDLIASEKVAQVLTGDKPFNDEGALRTPNMLSEWIERISGAGNVSFPSNLHVGEPLAWRRSNEEPTILTTLRASESIDSAVKLKFEDEHSKRLGAWEVMTRNRTEILAIDGTLYDAMKKRGIPEGFSDTMVELTTGHIDFRRDLRGGETVALAWQEEILSNGIAIGKPRLAYARLTLGDRMYEVVSRGQNSPLILLENGEAVQRSTQPVTSARLSSGFGNRKHPVLGRQRMHTGVDYAAPIGTPVISTGAGRVVFAGNIRGYGRTIDIEHDKETVTRYAHLSRISPEVSVGSRVKAGDQIGAVGATGLVSGPNLHYEVRLNGSPVNPLDHLVLTEHEAKRTPDIVTLNTWRSVTSFPRAAEGGQRNLLENQK